MSAFRSIAAMLALIGLFYCGWALHRIGAAGISDHTWPRPFPYPDQWVDQYGRWLDLRYPAPNGTIKFHGEVFRVRVTLWAIIVAFVAVLALVVAPAVRKLRSQLGAPPNGGPATPLGNSGITGGRHR
jgi:hypothetical protein